MHLLASCKQEQESIIIHILLSYDLYEIKAKFYFTLRIFWHLIFDKFIHKMCYKVCGMQSFAVHAKIACLTSAFCNDRVNRSEFFDGLHCRMNSGRIEPRVMDHMSCQISVWLLILLTLYLGTGNPMKIVEIQFTLVQSSDHFVHVFHACHHCNGAEQVQIVYSVMRAKWTELQRMQRQTDDKIEHANNASRRSYVCNLALLTTFILDFRFLFFSFFVLNLFCVPNNLHILGLDRKVTLNLFE